MSESLSGLRHDPPLREMRGILEQKITIFQQQGFNAFLEAEALAVQEVTSPAEQRTKTEQVTNFRATAKNADAAVTRLKELLAALPMPEPEKKQ